MGTMLLTPAEAHRVFELFEASQMLETARVRYSAARRQLGELQRELGKMRRVGAPLPVIKAQGRLVGSALVRVTRARAALIRAIRHSERILGRKARAFAKRNALAQNARVREEYQSVA